MREVIKWLLAGWDRWDEVPVRRVATFFDCAWQGTYRSELSQICYLSPLHPCPFGSMVARHQAYVSRQDWAILAWKRASHQIEAQRRSWPPTFSSLNVMVQKLSPKLWSTLFAPNPISSWSPYDGQSQVGCSPNNCSEWVAESVPSVLVAMPLFSKESHAYLVALYSRWIGAITAGPIIRVASSESHLVAWLLTLWPMMKRFFGQNENGKLIVTSHTYYVCTVLFKFIKNYIEAVKFVYWK